MEATPLKRRHALAVAALAAIGTLCGVGSGWTGQAQPPAPPKVAVAVLPYTGPAAGVPEGFGDALRQAIVDGLRGVRAIRLADPAAIQAAAQQAGLALGEPLSDEALLRLGRALQVRAVATGTFSLVEGVLTLQTRIADLAATPHVLAGEEATAPPADFLKPQERTTRQLLRQLQVRAGQYDEQRLTAAFVGATGSLEAYALYAQGAWQYGLGVRESQERAVALLTKAVELDQNFIPGRLLLGQAFYATNNRWKGSGEFRKVIQIDENNAEGHRLLGDMLVSSPRRMYDQAIQAYQKTLSIWPDCAEAQVGLGDAYQAKGQFDEAIREYQKALAIEPDNARVHFGMGKILYNEKQLYHEAVAEYQRAIALDPKLMEVHLSLGELYEEKGLYQEAIARYRHVLSVEPKHAMATYGLALAYEKVDVPKAVAAWEAYLELATSSPSEKEWLDIARRHLNKLKRGEMPK